MTLLCSGVICSVALLCSCDVYSDVQVNKFQMAYCNLLKSNMDGLKKQQKKQKTKKATL